MSDSVTLLLLLSALLSALTGAGGDARAPQAAVSVARAVAAEARVAQAIVPAARPMPAAPVAPALIAGTPLRLAVKGVARFGERRRE